MAKRISCYSRDEMHRAGLPLFYLQSAIDNLTKNFKEFNDALPGNTHRWLNERLQGIIQDEIIRLTLKLVTLLSNNTDELSRIVNDVCHGDQSWREVKVKLRRFVSDVEFRDRNNNLVERMERYLTGNDNSIVDYLKRCHSNSQTSDYPNFVDIYDHAVSSSSSVAPSSSSSARKRSPSPPTSLIKSKRHKGDEQRDLTILQYDCEMEHEFEAKQKLLASQCERHDRKLKYLIEEREAGKNIDRELGQLDEDLAKTKNLRDRYASQLKLYVETKEEQEDEREIELMRIAHNLTTLMNKRKSLAAMTKKQPNAIEISDSEKDFDEDDDAYEEGEEERPPSAYANERRRNDEDRERMPAPTSTHRPRRRNTTTKNRDARRSSSSSHSSSKHHQSSSRSPKSSVSKTNTTATTTAATTSSTVNAQDESEQDQQRCDNTLPSLYDLDEEDRIVIDEPVLVSV